MSGPLEIDLSGLEDKWSLSGRQLCAVCGFDFDHHDPDPEDGCDVPLLVWRNDGKEMLTLCWGCAMVRMQRTGSN